MRRARPVSCVGATGLLTGAESVRAWAAAGCACSKLRIAEKV